MDPWVKIPPLVSNPSFIPCMGIIKDYNGDLFVLSELVTDYMLTNSHQNKYEIKVNEINNKNYLKLDRQNTTMSDYWKKVANYHTDPLFLMMEKHKNEEMEMDENGEYEFSDDHYDVAG